MSIELSRDAKSKIKSSQARNPLWIDRTLRLFFTSAELLSHRADHAASATLRFAPPEAADRPARPSTWLFVASYGEVVLIKGYLDALQRAQLISSELLVICNQLELAASIQRVFPSAIVVASDGRLPHARALAERFPPSVFVISEVPCVPGDAPCRLSPSLLNVVSTLGVPIVLVNGWLYHQQPASRIDKLAAAWLTRDYLRNINVLCVQNENQRIELVARGAIEERVAIVGNVKFDAAVAASANSSVLVEKGREILSGRKAFAAGCLREHDDVGLVIDAWKLRIAHDPSLLLVLAPRYPNSATMMSRIETLLQQNAVDYVLRTDEPDPTRMQRVGCLVLNTVGELASVYAASSANFVGRDHNLLEAIQCGVPTATTCNWNPHYPGFGILEALTASAAVEKCDTPDQLHRFIAQSQARHVGSIEELLSSLTGAVNRAVELTRRAMQSARIS